MAKELPYFKFEPNQWENGNVQICSREDKGLFIDLCSMYWSRLGDLPIKLALMKLCAGNATALDSLIDEGIFKVVEGMICISFLNEQLQEFDDTSNQNSKNALLGWEKRRKASDRNATASNSQSESDARREEKKREEKRKQTIFSFDQFWEVYPNKTAKKSSAKKYKNISESDREKIKDSIHGFVNNKPFATYSHPNPLTYLNGARWEDEIKGAAVVKNIITDYLGSVGMKVEDSPYKTDEKIIIEEKRYINTHTSNNVGIPLIEYVIGRTKFTIENGLF